MTYELCFVIINFHTSLVRRWTAHQPHCPHKQCLCSHCACTVSRDMCVGGKFSPHLKSLTSICMVLCYLYVFTTNINLVIRQNRVQPCVKGHNNVCTCTKARYLATRGKKQLHIWNRRPQFVYTLYSCCRAAMNINGRLPVSMSILLKPYLGENL